MAPQLATLSDSESPASVLPRVKSRLRLLYITGILAAVLFFLTLFSLGDALQSLMRHDFNRFDVIAGEETLISGQLPADITSHLDIKVQITGEETLHFTPLETYKGFWLGGKMWRGTVAAGTGIGSSQAVLTIIDLIPRDGSNDEAQELVQNASLVYPLFVWGSAKEKDQASTSIFRRFFGINAFAVAVLGILSALLVTFTNSLMAHDVERKLDKASIYMLLGRKQEESGYVISFPSPLKGLPLDAQIYLYDRHWRMQGLGKTIETDKKVTKAMVPLSSSPQFGWFVSFHKV